MWARLKAKLKGFRTFIGAGLVALVGVLQIVGSMDIEPIQRLFVSNENTIGIVLVALGIFFGVMRFYTDTAPGVGIAPEPFQSAPVKTSVADMGV